MKTKTVFLSSVIGALGVISASAQVYSVNAVGYVNKELPNAGFHLISNPLVTDANTLDDLFPDVPGAVYTSVYKWNATTQTYDPSNLIPTVGWIPSLTLEPGEGAFIQTTAATTITFIGEVAQGQLSTPIAAGFTMMSSEVPQTVDLNDANFSFPAEANDAVYRFDSVGQTYLPANYIEGFGWAPTENVAGIAPGEAWFYSTGNARSWDRTFSVNE